ncbi:hypothetical protein T10_2537 [Trichinella papuae]|uniref:Uncharacterized protein n=1 Tax=Trichinella papuae TaxID=268474 RepID=A0A0V1N2R3_9BILA|nr:hypothetical protein T10_2537 [Trichinella papuae]
MILFFTYCEYQFYGCFIILQIFTNSIADIVFLALLIATILHSMGLVTAFLRSAYIRTFGNSCLKRWECLVQAVCIYLLRCTSIIALAKVRNQAVPAFCLRFHVFGYNNRKLYIFALLSSYYFNACLYLCTWLILRIKLKKYRSGLLKIKAAREKQMMKKSSIFMISCLAGRALPLTIFCIKSMVASKSDYIVVPALYWGLRPLSRFNG